MKSIHSLISVVGMIDMELLTADNTPAAIDLMGYEAAEVILRVGAGGITFSDTNKIEFKLTHSDNNSTYTAVVAADLVGAPTVGTGGIIKSCIVAKAAVSVDSYGYIGCKRYLKLLADFSGTHGTGTLISASVIKGRAQQNP